jgi:hypothetical protein
MSCMVTTHTMVVELSREVVVSFMRWLFREATTCFSLLALSPLHHQKSYVALHATTYGTADVYNVLALRKHPHGLPLLSTITNIGRKMKRK